MKPFKHERNLADVFEDICKVSKDAKLYAEGGANVNNQLVELDRLIHEAFTSGYHSLVKEAK